MLSIKPFEILRYQQKMLAEGLSIGVVSAITGLSIDQINQA
jgi:hypothetical protein